MQAVLTVCFTLILVLLDGAPNKISLLCSVELILGWLVVYLNDVDTHHRRLDPLGMACFVSVALSSIIFDFIPIRTDDMLRVEVCTVIHQVDLKITT
jgi:hypothetical protein